jgi:hypothetical protein
MAWTLICKWRNYSTARSLMYAKVYWPANRPTSNLPATCPDCSTNFAKQLRFSSHLQKAPRHYLQAVGTTNKPPFPDYPLSIHPLPDLHNYENRTRTEPHRRQAIGKKQCFICRKEGCWSNRHSQEEQEESR